MQTLGYLFPGDHCGEGALVTGNPHRATVRAVDPSTVLKISHSGFRALASKHRELIPYLRDQVRDIAYRNFTKCLQLDIVNLREGMQLFFQGLERTTIAAGQKVVLKGDATKGLYLVGRGTLRLTASGQPAKMHEAGDFFFGVSAPDQIALETETEVVLYVLSHADFARVLEKAPQIVRVFEEPDQNESEPESLPQNGRVNMLKIEPELRIADQSPRKLRDYIAFPYIKQHDETDCGAACLGMICQYYGQSIGLNRLRDMANVSREGTSLSALADLRNYLIGYVGARLSISMLSHIYHHLLQLPKCL